MPFDGLESPLNHVAQLDRVIDLIGTPSQWTKHTYRSPWGQYCLKEALNVVGVAEQFEPILLKAASDVTEKEFCCIESFNDHPLTTHADVLTVLRHARSDMIMGIATERAPGMARASVRWDEFQATGGGGGWGASMWRKLFCWS